MCCTGYMVPSCFTVSKMLKLNYLVMCCSTVIEFAAHSNKRMFFLKMEEFTPQAWFQMHMGSRKYYKFIDDDSFNENIGRFIEIIEEAGTANTHHHSSQCCAELRSLQESKRESSPF